MSELAGETVGDRDGSGEMLPEGLPDVVGGYEEEVDAYDAWD